MLQIRPMGPNTGGEVTGVDVKQLDDEGFAPIYAAWLKYGVIVVRDQQLEIEDFLHYSRRFGDIALHPSKSTRHPDYPEVRCERQVDREHLPARRARLPHRRRL